MSKIKIFSLGGLNEIGKNMYVIEIDKDILVIDAGLKYADEQMLGIDYVIPNIDYLKENIKRLELIDSYNMKMQNASNQKKRDYYKEGMIMLFQAGENFQNYHQILKEYRNALFVREQRIDDLYNEIKIIKKLKV